MALNAFSHTFEVTEVPRPRVHEPLLEIRSVDWK